ncbi:Sugar phosphate isomerase/epimerase [Methanophagales archaeon]|nr:Sugar phosphate isomerase/epimerase [Methanophagales archaeon]
MFKLSYGTNGYQAYKVQEAIQKIKELGYEGIDLMADRPHAYPADLNQVERQILREFTQDLGIEIANLNASSVSAIYEEEMKKLKGMNIPPSVEQFCAMYEPSFVSQSEECRRKRIEYIKQSIDLAVDLGVKNISTFSGIRLPGTPPAEAWEWLISGLEECLDYAIRKQIKIALEPEPFHLIESIEDMVKLIEEVESKNLGINFDIGHCYCIEKSLDTICDAIGDLKDEIIHLHVEDIKDKKHYHLIPGEGDIGEVGFRKILETLKQIRYTGFLTVELYTYNTFPDFAAKQAKQFLTRLLNKNNK